MTTHDRNRDAAPVTRARPMRTGHRVRILVADDHALLRQALRMMLEAQEGLVGMTTPFGPTVMV